MEGLTKGRIVRYVLPEDKRNSIDDDPVRPAMVTHVWPDDAVNLQVMYDPQFDGLHPQVSNPPMIHYDPEAAGGTWHWPGDADEPLLQVADEPEPESSESSGEPAGPPAGDPQAPQVPEASSMTVSDLSAAVGTASLEQVALWLDQERALGDDARSTAVKLLERELRTREG